ncbi:MAG TPA: M48 family metallopeptidase [Candidatus Binatia bacterium]|nr:M48 family metallopeptidase [Candidatus Binatia bacterium]
MTRVKQIFAAAWMAFSLGALTAGCAIETTSAPPPSSSREARTPNIKPLDPSQAARLQRIMVPLVRAGDKTRSLKEIRVGVIEDANINAANAGGGVFYVTTGLLQKANDEQLRGILAHEIAHDDLGHVARAQVLGVGLNLGVILLEQIIPGSSTITPIAGELVARAHSRSEELAADRHAVEILQRAGYSKDVMIDTLAWVMKSSGSDGGGFLSTHPATEDRIAALQKSK